LAQYLTFNTAPLKKGVHRSLLGLFMSRGASAAKRNVTEKYKGCKWEPKIKVTGGVLNNKYQVGEFKYQVGVGVFA
jgi:hypothetical protein